MFDDDFLIILSSLACFASLQCAWAWAWAIEHESPPEAEHLHGLVKSVQFHNLTSSTILRSQVALDWTPNTNHTGFFVAKSKGWYKEVGLEVTLVSPHVDGYKSTPATRVAERQVEFAICPSESVISYYTHPDGCKPNVIQDHPSFHLFLKSLPWWKTFICADKVSCENIGRINQRHCDTGWQWYWAS